MVSLAGCAGGGTDNGGGGGGGGGTTDRSYPVVNLGANGYVRAVFLSGSARRDVGSQIAVITQVQFQNGVNDFIPTTDQTNYAPIQVMLDSYSMNTRDIPVVFSQFDSSVSKHYTEYPMTITKLLEVTDTDPFYQELVGSVNFPAVTVDQPFDIDLRVFPGRHSTLTIKLDEMVLSYDSQSGKADFDVDRFTDRNYDPRFKLIRGQLSDYVAFDLSAVKVADRPVITLTGNAAEKVYFSGDGIAISEGMGLGSTFELLDPVEIQDGVVYEGPFIGGQQAANTYLLQEPDPSLNSPVITSLSGIWRDRKSVITSTDTVSAVAFPNTDDSERQQFVIYKENSAGEIVTIWEGVVEYNTDGDTSKGIFRIFPISTITDAVPTAEVSGTLSGLVYVNGVVRRGNWDITSSTPSGFGLPLSGGFAVFRR